MLPEKIAFVDIETTGASLYRDRVIEIGIIRVENNIVVNSFSSFVNPQVYIPADITYLTGISQREVENAPTFRMIMSDIEELIKDCYLAAHNVRFDYGFLINEFRRHNKRFSSRNFCTVKLSRHLFPRFKRHNLDSIIERFNIPCKNRHRAFDDASVLWEFYKKIQEKFQPDKISTAFDTILKRPAIPIQIDHDVIDNLPESPGVYLFYSKENAPLYIGKSKNIKNRVLNHFTSALRSSIEMKICQQVQRIEIIQTSGELGALFKESDLIKRLQPIYNRKLRIRRQLLVAKKAITELNYQTVSLETMDTIDPLNADKILGVFRSKKQATQFLRMLARKHSLCEKLLSLESGKGECFSYRLGWCKGACNGEENYLQYNMRFIGAFTNSHIKPWPFKGPIVISERNEIEGTTDAFLIDKWCFLGSISSDSLENELYSSYEMNFDLDTYKILASFLRSKNSFNQIHVVIPKIVSRFSNASSLIAE